MLNRIKKFFTPNKTLGAVVILCLALVASSFFTNKLVKPIRVIVSSFVVPLQKGINTIGSGMVNEDNKKRSIAELEAANKDLQSQLDILKEENKQLKTDTKDLGQLKELYKMDKSLASYKKVGASVIGGSTQNWNESVMIDKGSKDGMKVNMNVINSDGLVGIITEVEPNYSIVTTILADTSYVTAMDKKTNDQCTVKGDISLMNSGHISLERIKSSSKIADGDEIVTSNLSSKYLEGLLIGRAANMKTDPSTLSKSGNLVPAVNFDRLQKVLVITDLKQAADKK